MNYIRCITQLLLYIDENSRVDFSFQEAKFEFKYFPLTIPYPVPFTLLGDEAKGYIKMI